MGSIGHPDKTDPPLVVDSDTVTVLPSTISFQFLQPVSSWSHQVFEVGCTVEHRQLPFSDLPEAGEFPDRLSCKELSRLFVPKNSDHGIQSIMILRFT